MCKDKVVSESGSWLVYRVVEYVRQFDVWFDVEDVLDDLQGVLASYGVCAVLTGWEQELLKAELVGLAEQAEFREVSRLVLKEEELLI
ncbi:MAG: hypothetical protein KJ593_07525 [Candidatus Omnitrophica bacterium]|nr:hypothetical protein [Candidatus Omnitrophota bacterium]